MAVCSGDEGVTVVEFSGWGPGACLVIPERVVGSCVKRSGVPLLGSESELQEVVVVIDPNVLDGAGTLVRAGLRICGFDLVTDLDLADRFGLAFGHEDWSVR